MEIYYFAVFILGTVVGSFLNVVILRYNTGESILFPESRCFSCGKKLRWFELIPILSFLLQKGRCLRCKSKISRQYPITELLTGLTFFAIFWKFYPSIESVIFYWTVASFLIVISVYDFRHQIIPNGLVYFLIFLSLFPVFFSAGGGNWSFFGNWKFGIGNSGLLSRLLAGVVFGGFFASLWLASKGGWMGLGEAKLALGIGWLLGFPAGIIAVLFSFWLGAIVGVFLLLFLPKKFTLKSRIPFGPFLCLGTMVDILFYGDIIKIYFYFLNLWT